MIGFPRIIVCQLESRRAIFWEEDRYSNESGVRETDNNYLYAYAQLSGNFNKFIYNAGVSGAMSRYGQLDRNCTFLVFPACY